MVAIPPVITLLTDFGTVDGYVAQMKGVVLQIRPDAQIVDITHQIQAQDIRGAARTLRQTAVHFPVTTVHVAVVDPGVGTQRRILAAEIGDWYFIAPDNGLLSEMVRDFELKACYEVVSPDIRLCSVSNTFHGRDIMAPAAAHWCAGRKATEFGPAVVDLVRLPELAVPKIDGGGASSTVVSIDHFGNVAFRANDSLVSWLHRTATIEVQSAAMNWLVARLVETYGQATPGELVVLKNSQGGYEVSVVNGSAARLLAVATGDPIKLQAKPAP